MKLQFIRPAPIRKFAKENNRRIGKGFLYSLDNHISRLLSKAISTHNGGKKTLDASVAAFVGIK